LRARALTQSTPGILRTLALSEIIAKGIVLDKATGCVLQPTASISMIQVGDSAMTQCVR